MKKLITNGLLMFFITVNLNSQTAEPYGNLLYEDTLEFSPLHSWISIDNSETNSWKIGMPNKTYFNASHSGKRAISTDSVNFYPNNCNDYFYITIPWSQNYWGEGILSFYHKFDTDTLTDGGVIEISYDKGASWMNILDDKDHIAINFTGLYNDTIRGGEFGFSGKSDGWQYVELYWFWIALVKKSTYENLDTPIIRFKFVSDNVNTNKEGWMIDDIVFRGYDAIGAVHDIAQNKIAIFPTPAADFINIKTENANAFGLTIDIFELSGRLVKSQKITNNQLNISDLDAGPYLYKVLENGTTLSSGKLIKK